MAKIPRSPEEIFEEFTSDWRSLYDQELISIILFGSGAAGTYVPKKSDINFLIILTETGIARMAKSFNLVKKWQKRNVALPLVMTTTYLKNSLDSFPVEFDNMKRHYRVVHGQDVLVELTFEREKLRLQAETQIKGKLLHLRESFLGTHGRRGEIEKLIRISLPTFANVFSVLLRLKGEDAARSRDQVILRTAEVFDLDQGLFTQLIEVANGKMKLSTEEMIKISEGYIIEIRKLALASDALQ
jgi:hypothetical protein